MSRIRRRKVLVMLGGTALLPAVLADGAAAAPHPSDTIAVLRQSIRHPRSARRLGEEYLREAPTEANVAELKRHLGLDANGRTVRENLRGIAYRHTQDLREGRSHQLGGYRLSRTELRLYALLSLSDVEP